MAKHLDLEEQEQLDQLKHFWSQWGNLITWVLIVVLGAMAAWNGWRYWERSQASKAAALHDEIERAVQAQDSTRIQGALQQMQDRFASTAYASQGSLLAASALYEQGKKDEARRALAWVADEGADDAYRATARLRQAAMDLEAGQYQQAIEALEGKVPLEYRGLFDDRKADVLLAQGKADEARVLYESAWRALDSQNPYRRLVEVKLASLGVDAKALNPTKEP